MVCTAVYITKKKKKYETNCVVDIIPGAVPFYYYNKTGTYVLVVLWAKNQPTCGPLFFFLGPP